MDLNLDYSSANALELEKLVSAQIIGSSNYDFESNKMLLKIYATYPEMVKMDMILSTLILSMMQLPNTDFLAMTYLVPLSCKSDEKYKLILSCVSHLEGGRFKEFWEIYNDDKTLFSAKDFLDGIRNFIMKSIRNTFSSIEKSLITIMLGFSNSNEVDNFIKISPEVDTTSSNTNSISLIKNSENQKSSSNYGESLKVTEIFGLLNNVQTAAVDSKNSQF